MMKVEEYNVAENGIANISVKAEELIRKFENNKYSINIEQARLIIDYLLVDRKLDDDYIEMLEKELEENNEEVGDIE